MPGAARTMISKIHGSAAWKKFSLTLRAFQSAAIGKMHSRQDLKYVSFSLFDLSEDSFTQRFANPTGEPVPFIWTIGS